MKDSSLIRRADQLTIAILVLVIMLGMASWWISRGGLSGGLIDIDQADSLSYQFSVDLNQAEWPELAQLPGIGETLAKRIVASRQEQGPFLSPNDLQRVQGIGPRKFEQMLPYLLPISETGLAKVETTLPNK